MEYLPIPMIDDLKYIIYQYAFDDTQMKKVNSELKDFRMRTETIMDEQDKHLLPCYIGVRENYYKRELEKQDVKDTLYKIATHRNFSPVSTGGYLKGQIDIRKVFQKKRAWKFYLTHENYYNQEYKTPFILDIRKKVLTVPPINYCDRTKYDENHFKIYIHSRRIRYTHMTHRTILTLKIIYSDSIINVKGLTQKDINKLKIKFE